MKPVQPDAALGKIVGNRAQPRTELMRNIWNYIKAHHLQDAEDGRVIHPDETLAEVVGHKDRVSMFEIPRSVSAHVRS